MKIRLFKPKTLSKTEISITVEVFNSPAHFCLKGNNLHNRRYATCGQRRPCNLCLKGRTTAVAQTNIRTGRKRTNKTKIRSLKFSFLYFPFLYFLLILNYQLSIIPYIITPPRLRRYPSYLKRGIVLGSRLP
jgi:hypothetical protein